MTLALAAKKRTWGPGGQISTLYVPRTLQKRRRACANCGLSSAVAQIQPHGLFFEFGCTFLLKNQQAIDSPFSNLSSSLLIVIPSSLFSGPSCTCGSTCILCTVIIRSLRCFMTCRGLQTSCLRSGAPCHRYQLAVVVGIGIVKVFYLCLSKVSPWETIVKSLSVGNNCLQKEFSGQ